MKKKVQPPLVDRLLAKMQSLGMPTRKAKEMAKGLAPTAARQKVTGTVTGKLTDKLFALGLSERKAKELAKALAPVVRSSIKAKAKKQARKLDEVDDAFVNEIVNEGVDLSEDAELDKVAPRVNGHRVRLDLPVVSRHTWMTGKATGIELLRVIDGLTTTGTYLSAAVKKDVGIVAVRQFSQDSYNVKFYPTMAYWNKTEEELRSLGATDFLRREWYERMYFNQRQLDQLMGRLAAEAKPKNKIKALMKRFMAVTGAPLVKAFDYLHKRRSVAA